MVNERIDWDWNTTQREHIENRRVRDGSDNIAVAWTLEAWNDPQRVMHDPDPRNTSGGETIRCIGYAPSGKSVITVIAIRVEGELFGITAWTTTGKDLRNYLEGHSDD